MATIDVSGRTLRESRGKARPKDAPKNCLVGSAEGLIPKQGHTGISVDRVPHRSGSVNATKTNVATGVNSLAPEEVVRGKKHVEVSHQVFSEEGKRQQGRIGIKKVVPPHQSPRSGSLSATPERRQASVERMRLCTAEQRAKKKLTAVAASHPDLQPLIAMGISKGGDILVDLERKIEKHLFQEEVRSIIRAKSPSDQRPRSADLGAVSSSIHAPFALLDASGKPSKESVQHGRLSQRKTFFHDPSIVQESQAMPVTPARFSKKLDPNRPSSASCVPYDTAAISAVYPEPPRVGVPAHVPQGKGHISFVPEVKNIDEELQKKALARKRFSNNQDTITIFGSSLAASDAARAKSPAVSSRPTLTQQVEARCKEKEDLTGRRGKLVSSEKYRSTALW